MSQVLLKCKVTTPTSSYFHVRFLPHFSKVLRPALSLTLLFYVTSARDAFPSCRGCENKVPLEKCCSDLINCRLLGSSFGYRHSWLTVRKESALDLVVPVLGGQSCCPHITESCLCPSNPNPLERSKMLFFLDVFLFKSEEKGVKDPCSA